MNDANKNVPEGLRRDTQWKLLEGRLCRISDFKPFPNNKVVDDVVISSDKTVPYAGFRIECRIIPQGPSVVGYCTQKNDFVSLWSAFKSEYHDPKSEEILMFWTTKHYNHWIFKVLSLMAPKMVVFKAKKGTFEKFINVSWPKGVPLADVLSKLKIEDMVFIPEALQRKR